MLLGREAMERLKASSVAVVGLGGVGSWCAEALARTGVGRLILLDMDLVSATNLNRQSCALQSTLGLPKTMAMARRLSDAAPGVELTLLQIRYQAENGEELFGLAPDYIADCIDTVTSKLDLICQAERLGTPIISAMGTGNKAELERLRVSDISATSGCPLARVMRRELRRRGVERLEVVWSDEKPMTPEDLEAPPPGRRGVPGSLMWVPAAAGLLMAQRIVKRLTDIQ